MKYGVRKFIYGQVSSNGKAIPQNRTTHRLAQHYFRLPYSNNTRNGEQMGKWVTSTAESSSPPPEPSLHMRQEDLNLIQRKLILDRRSRGDLQAAV